MSTKKQPTNEDVSRYAAKLRAYIFSKEDYSIADRKEVLRLVKIIESKETNAQKMEDLKKIADDYDFHKK